MIHNRRVARSLRIERQRVLLSQIQDLQVEAQFEVNLTAKGARFMHFFSSLRLREWKAPLDSNLDELHAAFERDVARATRPTPPNLMHQLRAARREKVINKTREREREARGEVLSATRYRSRLGFPAHVLARWAPEVRKSYLLARRSVGLVGYVGHVKRKLGYKIPSEEDHTDKATRESLDDLAENIRRINQSRRNWETWRERSVKDREQGPREIPVV
jgi:hypothetical protein